MSHFTFFDYITNGLMLFVIFVAFASMFIYIFNDMLNVLYNTFASKMINKLLKTICEKLQNKFAQ